MQDPAHCFKDVPTWVLAELVRGPRHDLTATVAEACFYRAGTLQANETAGADAVESPARTSAAADPAHASLVMTTTAGAGRVVVTADSDIFGDDSITDLDHRRLWLNLVTWAAGGRAASGAAADRMSDLAADPAWIALTDGVESLRPLQSKDGSIDLTAHDREVAADLVARICAAIEALAPRFPHQADHLAVTVVDLRAWADGGFGVPDFVESLRLFHPDARREDGIEHLVVFPMYTQNGNPNRNVEAVVTRTFWPEWLAAQEADVLRQPRVRAHRVRRLHQRVRHQLGGAVPRDRRHARDPDVHVGRDLLRPRGGPLPARRARGVRHPAARRCRQTSTCCSTTSSWPRRPS